MGIRRLFVRIVTQIPEPDLSATAIQRCDALLNPFALRLILTQAHSRIRPGLPIPAGGDTRARDVKGPIRQEWG